MEPQTGLSHWLTGDCKAICREADLLRAGVEPADQAQERLKRDKPDALAVPESPNVTLSMDFMADRLGDGRAFRLLNVTCSPE